MNLFVILLLALSLAMDAFAVSIVQGLSTKNNHLKQAVIMALFFGLFQAIMPILGWFAGNTFSKVVSEYNGWVVFAILFFIGAKMIYESFGTEDKETVKKLSFYTLTMLALATSIDAFAVGISFSLLNTKIYIPVLIIGIVTFILSFTGAYIGKQIGTVFGRKMEAVGGLILIVIGICMLLESYHTI